MTTTTTTTTTTASFTTPAGPLLRAVTPMIVKRCPVPTLGNVLVTTTADRVTVQAFDYETARTFTVTTTTATPGAPFVVSAAGLADAVKGLTSGMTPRARDLAAVTVTATTTGADVTVDGMTVPVPFLGESVADYPASPPAASGVTFTVDAGALSPAVAHVARSAGTSTDMPVLRAVRVTVSGHGVHLLSTDRYRMHEVTATTPAADVTPADVVALVPATFLAAFDKLTRAGKLTGPVTVTIGESIGTLPVAVSLSAGGHTWQTTTTDGRYPPVDLLFPTEGERASIDGTALAAVVKRASSLGDKRAPVRLDADGTSLHVLAAVGDATVHVGSVPCDLPSSVLPWSVNGAYLSDALAGHPGATELLVSDRKPMLLTSGDVRSLIMPTRMAGDGPVTRYVAATTTPAEPSFVADLPDDQAAASEPVAWEPPPIDPSDPTEQGDVTTPTGSTPGDDDPIVVTLAGVTVTLYRSQLADGRVVVEVDTDDDDVLARTAVAVNDHYVHGGAARETTTTPTEPTTTATTTGGAHKHRALPGDDVPPRCACGFRQSRTPAPGRALSDHLARFAGR